MHLLELQVVKAYSHTKSCTFNCETIFRRVFKWNLKFLIACYKSKQCCFFPSWAPHCHMLHSFLSIVLMLGIVTELYRSSRRKHLSLLSSSNALTSTHWVAEQSTAAANAPCNEQTFLKQPAAMWAWSQSRSAAGELGRARWEGRKDLF